MMFKIVKPSLMFIALMSAVVAMPAYSQALDINKILRDTNSATSKDRSSNANREAKFKKALSSARGKLSAAKKKRVNEEVIGKKLENQIESNETAIADLQDDLARELGDLKELFGVIQQTASEAQEDYKSSLISAQYPERSENLRVMVEKMASLTELVSIDEIEDLWFQLQNEMTEQGKVVTFKRSKNRII